MKIKYESVTGKVTKVEVVNLAELLLSEKGAFITGSDFLIDGGVTATYFYGDKV